MNIVNQTLIFHNRTPLKTSLADFVNAHTFPLALSPFLSSASVPEPDDMNVKGKKDSSSLLSFQHQAQWSYYISLLSGRGNLKRMCQLQGEKTSANSTLQNGGGGKGSAFIRPGLCEVTAGMQEVGLMWRPINLYCRPSALSTRFKSSAVVWGLVVFFHCMCDFQTNMLLYRI